MCETGFNYCVCRRARSSATCDGDDSDVGDDGDDDDSERGFSQHLITDDITGRIGPKVRQGEGIQCACTGIADCIRGHTSIRR